MYANFPTQRIELDAAAFLCNYHNVKVVVLETRRRNTAIRQRGASFEHAPCDARAHKGKTMNIIDLTLNSCASPRS